MASKRVPESVRQWRDSISKRVLSGQHHRKPKITLPKLSATENKTPVISKTGVKLPSD